MNIIHSMIPQTKQETLTSHFDRFRRNIVGIDQSFDTPYGKRPIVYVDWTASGRLYDPIERKLLERFGPFVGNTHSESSVTGSSMTHAYHHANEIIKKHVHASPNDALLNVGFGMTAAINKLQRLLGLRVPEQLKDRLSIKESDRPVVFITHMEHHSNHTSWQETIADVVVIKPNAEGLVDVEDLHEQLHHYKDRPWKIGSFTACSNVTGIKTPFHELARIMHEHGGWAFVDYACSAPYAPMDMHPKDPLEKLDAITFSPHKFLGGPGTSGILIFDESLYTLKSPDQPGGGTVLWTNPWGGHRYSDDIEVREDGGTPGFLQAIKSAMCVKLKEEMDPALMHIREEQLVARMFAGMSNIEGLTILAANVRSRQPLFSFYIDGVHYNLIVRLLNDRFGIQVRGGCSCAGTYGHILLHVDQARSQKITDRIDHGDHSTKPGWVRISLHPTTTDEEVDRIIEAVSEIKKKHSSWEKDYEYSKATNEYVNKDHTDDLRKKVETWFE